MFLIILLLLVDNFPQYINDIIFEKKENYWPDHKVLATAKLPLGNISQKASKPSTLWYEQNSENLYKARLYQYYSQSDHH